MPIRFFSGNGDEQRAGDGLSRIDDRLGDNEAGLWAEPSDGFDRVSNG